jgi:hypothetical protein
LAKLGLRLSLLALLGFAFICADLYPARIPLNLDRFRDSADDGRIIRVFGILSIPRALFIKSSNYIPDDFEFDFKADLLARVLRLNCTTAMGKGEMAYIIGANKMFVAITRNLVEGIDLSLMNTKELSSSNNTLSLNLSFLF